jgi:hypothetical protein
VTRRSSGPPAPVVPGRAAAWSATVVLLAATHGQAADPAQAQHPPTAASSSSSGAFVRVPALDEVRGRAAADRYEEARRGFCATPGSFANAHLTAGASRLGVCNDVRPLPVASGSFFVAGADEVLLEVPSGEAAALGEATLALMRKQADGYRLIRHLLASETFEALLRISVPGRVDVLMLCSNRGHMGLYPSECGFLGEGSFRPDGDDADARFANANEVQLVTVTVCGQQAWVERGEVALQGDRIVLPLVVVHARLRPSGPDEGYYCSVRGERRDQAFPLEFQVHGDAADAHGTGRVVRLTPIPREVTAVLDLY